MSLAILAGASSQAIAERGPRVPNGQWAVDYAKDVCILSREGIGAGPGIALRTRPFAREQDLQLLIPRTGEKKRWIEGMLSIDAQPAGARWISTGEPKRGPRLIDTRISVDELARFATARSLRLSGAGLLDVTVALSNIAKAIAALRACEVELAGRWGVAPDEMAKWAKTAISETNLPNLFWNGDRGKSVMLRHPVRALLDIDARGAVVGCRITQSSRVSWVDARFCETLRTKARFRPAMDGAGEAVPGKYVTPAITSAIGTR